MSSKDKILNVNVIEEDIENLKKDIYLDSPDIWLNLSSKTYNDLFDEMFLFFSIKYKYLEIVKFIIDNNLVNLESPSKNKSFKSIKDHMLNIAKRNDVPEIYDYINTPSQASDSSVPSYNYLPRLICPSCEKNIFECGYKTVSNTMFKFDSKENKLVQFDCDVLDIVLCCNCDYEFKDLTPNSLKALSSLDCCANCNTNLRSTGIWDKSIKVYNSETNTFIASSQKHFCNKCNHELSVDQINYFNL